MAQAQLKSANQATLTLLPLILLVKAGWGGEGVSYKTFPPRQFFGRQGVAVSASVHYTSGYT